MNPQIIALFVVANLFDLLTTHANGQENEANPIVAYVWRSGGFKAYALFKLASVAWGVFSYSCLYSEHGSIGGFRMDILAHAIFWSVTVLQTVVVLWNCFGFWYNGRYSLSAEGQGV